MKTITLIKNTIKLIPREYPLLTDSLTVELINEETGVNPNISFDFSLEKNMLVINILNPEILKEMYDYELSVFNNGKLIFKDKCVLLENNTVVQTFERQKQKTKRWRD